LTFPQTLTLRYGVFAPPEGKRPDVVADYTRWFAARLKAATPWLGETYAAADRFTAADVSVGYAIKLANSIGLAGAVPERAQDYWRGLQQRPALQRADAAEHPSTEHAA
jgi:glutathione S-transferase